MAEPVRPQPDPVDPVLLDVAHLSKRYRTGEDELEVLRDVSFAVRRGEVVAVIGESGTGKSTLLHVIGTLDRPSEGTVRYHGNDIFALNDDDLARFRNRSLGFVFQFHHLLPEFTALENVAMPALIGHRSLDETTSRAAELLDLVGLGARKEHRPAQLSGGERQRVAVARALMNGPELLIADEPTGNLDTRTAEALHDEFVELNRVLGQTYIIATHSPKLAALADRVLTIADGRLREESPASLKD